MNYKTILFIFSLSTGFFVGSQAQSTPPLTYPEIRKWVDRHFAKGNIPPFSFIYEGKRSDSFIKNWKFSVDKVSTTEPETEERRFTYSDPVTSLSVQCYVTIYHDFPAIEWVLKFSNPSATPSPKIESAAVIDFSFETSEKGTFILHHSKGSNAERSDFQPIDEFLLPGKNIYMTPSGGRSSDHTAFPFFNLEMPGSRGVVVAVGWTGKWYANVEQLNTQKVSLTSGMEKMSLWLYPKEEIRTPRICLLFWNGNDRMAGHNQFRQFVLTHHSRKINGHFAEYPLSGSFDYGDPSPCGEYNCLTADYAIALVKRYKQFHVLPELFWLDAGWYTGCGWDKKNGEWWQNVGNWTVDKERFPDGLRPVADAVHKTGAKFMVWFEPERVMEGTQLYREHPEWLIKLAGDKNSLFNLGNENARIWLTNYLTEFIKTEGIDYYRQDFNFDPKPYWDSNDRPDRIGISEIRHIEGLYAFWDSLLVRFPNLLIDNCASGGRRLDLETTSRSAPLWRTDYQYGEPNGYQCHTYGLNFYLPIHGTAIYQTDAYTFRSGLGATTVMNWEVTGRNSEPIPSIQKRIKDYQSLRPYFYGDYYPLTDAAHLASDSVWMAYQLNRPSQHDGIVVAFRRAASNDESIRVSLQGLEKASLYELTEVDSGKKVVLPGEEVAKGFPLTLREKKNSLLIRYQCVQPGAQKTGG